jgi:hypothetical protein
MNNPVVSFIKLLTNNNIISKYREIPDEFDLKDELLAEIERDGNLPDSMRYFEINGFSSPVDFEEFLKQEFNAFKISIISSPIPNQDILFREIQYQITKAKADLQLQEHSLKTLNDMTLNALIKNKIQACDNVLNLIFVNSGDIDGDISPKPNEIETIYGGVNDFDKKKSAKNQGIENADYNGQNSQMHPKPPDNETIYVFRMKELSYNTSRRCIFRLYKGLINEGYIDCPLPEFRRLFIRFSDSKPEISPNPVTWKCDKHNHFAYFIQCLSQSILCHSVSPSNTEIASKLFYKSAKDKYFTNVKARFDGKLRQDVKKRFDTIMNSLELPKKTTLR